VFLGIANVRQWNTHLGLAAFDSTPKGRLAEVVYKIARERNPLPPTQMSSASTSAPFQVDGLTFTHSTWMRGDTEEKCTKISQSGGDTLASFPGHLTTAEIKAQWPRMLEASKATSST
jgi:hypothetical protein